MTRLAEPITTNDPLLMTEDEYTAFLAPRPNPDRVYITNTCAPGVSGYRGVTPYGRTLWQARIKHHGISHSLGTFISVIDAAHAYDAKAKELHGEYAILNFPDMEEVAA